jgi:hypothetical protein
MMQPQVYGPFAGFYTWLTSRLGVSVVTVPIQASCPMSKAVSCNPSHLSQPLDPLSASVCSGRCRATTRSSSPWPPSSRPTPHPSTSDAASSAIYQLTPLLSCLSQPSRDSCAPTASSPSSTAPMLLVTSPSMFLQLIPTTTSATCTSGSSRLKALRYCMLPSLLPGHCCHPLCLPLFDLPPPLR